MFPSDPSENIRKPKALTQRFYISGGSMRKIAKKSVIVDGLVQ